MVEKLLPASVYYIIYSKKEIIFMQNGIDICYLDFVI